MVKLKNVYLRIGDEYAPELVRKGLEQALILGAELVKINNSPMLSYPDLVTLLSDLKDMGYTVLFDDLPNNTDSARLEAIRRYVSSNNVGIILRLPRDLYLDSTAEQFKGFTAEVSIGGYDTPFDIEQYITYLLEEIKFRDVKIAVQARILKNVPRYFEIIDSLRSSHSLYGERVKAIVPPVFLSYESMLLTRCICKFKQTIAILGNGNIAVCDVVVNDHTIGPSLKNTRLEEAIETYDLFNKICLLSPDTITGVCKRCIFVNFCLALCPAMNFNHENSFLISHLDCQYLYDRGAIPDEFLASNP